MRVLQINSVCGVGSTGRIATDIHRMLVDTGHESYIAFGRNAAYNCENSIRIGSRIDNYFHVAITRIFDKHGLGSKRATRHFVEQIKVLKPDIIHLHNIHGYYINYEILFGFLKEVETPVIWTFHDCWAFTGHCAHFDSIGCEKWKYACEKCPLKKDYPTSLVLDASRSNYLKKRNQFSDIKDMTIVTPSKWLEEKVKESMLSDYSIHTINNGIDTDIFKYTDSEIRKVYGLSNEFIILGVSGVWNENKGFNEFIKLSKMLDRNEIIILVGVTEKQKRNLPKNIIGITHTKSAIELVELYSSADVFVNLTREDTFPTVNMEAAACGLPVITYDTGGCRETVGENGNFVVTNKKVSEIIKICRTFQNNNPKRNTYCESDNSKYKRENMIKKYMELYNSIRGE